MAVKGPKHGEVPRCRDEATDTVVEDGEEDAMTDDDSSLVAQSDLQRVPRALSSEFRIGGAG